MDYELREMLLDYKPLIDDLYDYKTIPIYDLSEIVIICDYMIYKSNSQMYSDISNKLGINIREIKNIFGYRNSICHYMEIHGDNVTGRNLVKFSDYKVYKNIDDRIRREITYFYHFLNSIL